MGVCEGVPQSVVQDHLGRADYHGDIVNQVRPGAGTGGGGGGGGQGRARQRSGGSFPPG